VPTYALAKKLFFTSQLYYKDCTMQLIMDQILTHKKVKTMYRLCWNPLGSKIRKKIFATAKLG